MAESRRCEGKHRTRGNQRRQAGAWLIGANGSALAGMSSGNEHNFTAESIHQPTPFGDSHCPMGTCLRQHEDGMARKWPGRSEVRLTTGSDRK
jgi:hypothetical protein